MKDWTKTVGSHVYRFRAARVLDRAMSPDFRYTHANIRWDNDGKRETGCRFQNSLDVRDGDRMLIVEHASGFGLKENARVLITTVRADTFVANSNLPDLPGITFDGLKEELSGVFVLCLITGTAAAAAWHFLGPITAILTCLIGVLWYASQIEKRVRKRKLHKQALADQETLFSEASKTLGDWARRVRAEDDVEELAAELEENKREQERLRQARAAKEEASDTSQRKRRPFWEVLAVNRDATWDQVKAAHRTKMMQLHPDRHRQLPPELLMEAERLAKEINGALEEAKAQFARA